MAGRSYRRSLGLFALVSLGLGGTVGSGIAAGLIRPASLPVWLLVGLSAGAVAYALASSFEEREDALPLFQPPERVFGSAAADLLKLAYVVSPIFGCATIGAVSGGTSCSSACRPAGSSRQRSPPSPSSSRSTRRRDALRSG